MIRIYALLLTYYLLGIIAIAVINHRKKDGDTKARWTKLVVYLIITATITSLLFFASRLAIAASVLIVAVGLFELIRLDGLSGTKRLWILGGYCLLATLFCFFVSGSLTSKLPCIVYLVVLSFDGFSQISGQLIGGRKIAPAISPGKTWSGMAGGLLMGVVTIAFLNASFRPALLLAGLMICLLAFAGDLLASAIKRRAGVKDYSNLIPGHGGVLDRFDSFLFAGAVLECYFRLV